MIEAQAETISPIPAPHKRILVAEDSPVTQDLLKLILTQRGHEVDIADDGEQALLALNRTPYDVALIDFRLPKMDGLQVAQQYRSGKNGSARARLIAITADVEGLLSHKEDCENFDQIIPKPLDIYEVCNVIERGAAPGQEVEDAGEPILGDMPTWDTGSNGAQPSIARTQSQEPTWALGFELMRWPKDFGASRRLGNNIPGIDNMAEIDAILIHGRPNRSALVEIWDRKPLHLFPIIDLGGGLGEFADYDASKARQEDGDAVRQLVQNFHHRRGQLHRDLMTSSDLGEKLLARLFVQDVPLKASYAPEERSLTQFRVPLKPEDVMSEADKNCKSGFLRQEFFDRFHLCYRCSSSRLHIREECTSCRSPQLKEEVYIHHFKCGTQGVEADFRDGDRLVCPKCRQELTHFSVDYDKPGTLLVCGHCGHAESEATIGIVCMDCAAHFESDTATTRDVHSYHITPEGIAFVQMGYALRGAGQRSIRFSELPLDFVVALNAAAKKFNERKTPFTVLNLSYENEREIIREAGLRQFGQAREQFLENLRHLVGERGIVVKGHSYDFCLIHGHGPARFEADFLEIAEEAGNNLKFDLGLRTHLFGHEDFA